MAGGIQPEPLLSPGVECPYCGAHVRLHDNIGTWIVNCESLWLAMSGALRGGCGKPFVVEQKRRIEYTAKARRIEGE